MSRLKPAAEDLAARRLVWEALSDLFLDTDVSLSRQWRVSQLAQSPYTVEQLETVLIEEVYPICKYNLLSVAGEWSGFDPIWLEGQILKRLKSRFRLFHFFNLGKFTIRLSSEWRATKAGIAKLRSLDHDN